MEVNEDKKATECQEKTTENTPKQSENAEEAIEEKTIPVEDWKLDYQGKESSDGASPYSSHRILIIVTSILLALVVALAVLFAVVELNPGPERKDQNPPKEDFQYGGEFEEEVNFHTLIGTHAGQMRATAPGEFGIEEAVIEYRMVCSHGPPHHHSRMRCEMTQIGCTTVREGDMIDEECMMDDIGVTFDLDRDGNFYAEDADLLDPARLAVALHSKHISVIGEEYEEEVKNVQRRNDSFAIVKCGGLTLEVSEMPEKDLKKTHQKRKRRDIPSPSAEEMKMQQAKRKRRQVPPITQKLVGVFGEALSKVWKGGPYYRKDTLFSVKGKKFGIVKYEFRLEDFELLMSSLPDINVGSAAIITTNGIIGTNGYGCKLRLEADFSLGGECDGVIQSRVKVYADARACIWRWCFAKVKVDEYVSLNFREPMIGIDLSLTAGEEGMLEYDFKLQNFRTGVSVEGGIDIDINIGETIGGVLFGPIGTIGGRFLDRHLKRVAKKMYENYKKKVPEFLDRKAAELIEKNLPKSGSIKVGARIIALLKLYAETVNTESLQGLITELSKLTAVLDSLPLFWIPCTGTNLIKTVPDKCMHDFGRGGGGDHLEIYCINKFQRFCLSNELCPWREIKSPKCASMFELSTCSVAGLRLPEGKMMTSWGERLGSCKRKCKGWWFRKRCKKTCSCVGAKYTIRCDEGFAIIKQNV